MDRFLAHIRPPSLFSLSIVRRLSSFKPKSFDIKARIVERKTLRALLDLVDQLDASYLTGKNKLPVPPLVVDTTYLSIKSPDPRFPMPGRIGPDHNQQNKHIPAQSTTKLDPKRYGIDGKLLLDQLLTMTLPVDHQKDSITQLMGTHMVLSSPTNKKEFLSNLINHENLEIRAYDCPSLLRYELHRLFLNYNVLMQPLTAITIILKTNSDMSTWSPKIEEERNELTDQFIKLAHEMCAYLTGKQYWADFIDPSSGRPYYGPHTADTLFETDERYRYFGINIVDLGCCRVVEHLQHGTHIFIGCVFTSALKNDPNVEHLLKEFVNSNKKNKPLEDTTETENDNFMEDLAKALTDYHDPRIDLVYKQHLHEQLNRFLIDPNSWQIALATFQQQQHQNVVLSPLLIYFLLQVLEHSIRHRYGDQQQIRQILLWLFLHLFDSIPVFVRSKLCLLIVQIVRCDNQWSLDEYFQTCYHVRYSQVLSSLSQELIQRIHNGQSIINNLEETTDLNDSETAIDRYIRESVDILSKLADIPILSSNILNLLITLLQPDIEKYKNSSQQYLLINNESMGVCSQILNSLNYLLYAFSRIANSCLLDNNNQQQSHFQTRLTLVHQFVQLIIYIIHIRFDLIHCSSKQLQNEFINVQTRSFECVNNLSQWLSQMLVLHNSNQDNRRLIQELITHIIDNCAPLIDSNNFDKSIAISVGSILSSLIPLTRQHMTFNEMNSIKHLIHRILSWNVMSNLKTNFPLYKLSIKIVLLLILAEQQSAEHFLGTIFQPLNTILSEPTTFFNQQQEPGSMRRTFLEYTILLTEVIESIRTENNKIRQHLFSSIQHLIINLNRFLSVIINRDTECETVLISLLLICFEILRTQMGKELVNTILQTTFSVFNIENIRNVLREPKPTAHTAVSRFLEFLSVLVNEPGNSKLAQQFLPTIIELCTTALYPAIRENFALDIRENYYKLVHNLLINNWRYFFKGNVLTTLNGDTETTANEHSFIQLMESVAWSFSQSDIEQFRTNLSSCNELQLKCGLYTKSIFHQHMSQALLSLLLTVLLVRSHELCRDDIISTLFYILTNDKTNNFVYFIQNYLEQSNIKLVLNDKYKHALLENYSRNETDLPSFSENLNNFTHDYRHHTTTSSL
ncbi:unnamed protein product [Rotaria magnacalcarata]|uniref:Uncharacterized protein n=1 Tax=Rotaria magnacalcarata TaxID=392030 RepID=A0A8S2K502_9BILA|nr:unnamed protein product [Rotaria magnacalcarata]